MPLGFDDTIPASAASDGDGLVSFVGAPLPGRLRALTALADAGVPVRAWGRGWSDHPVDRARTWRLRSTGIPSARDVPAPKAHAIMRDSLATLNVHGDQDGFTMRTFEACGVGAVQLIDRKDVTEFYEPGRELLTFETPHELAEIAQRVRQHPDDFRAMRAAAQRRTLAEHTLTHRARRLEALWQ